ncbi:hypothetical protein [Spirosoma montaniterrae]|uniref:Uncharacterized protein n=1 Tax=Spirosoma montaniterrae TaxID=1178516 RepID=A0A1P9WT23_9BACT|nr:hypothetical protein [Spirosoma montaniterrae]AQG78546.1 hypothetical protein AWR27_03835 [Spirosoma montaniterrae]
MSDSSVAHALAKGIRAGFKAEQTLTEQVIEPLIAEARTTYGLAHTKATTLAWRAAKAVIRSLRHTDGWQSNMLGRMLHDQIETDRFQRDAIDDQTLARYTQPLDRYINWYVTTYIPDAGDDYKADIRQEVIARFYSQLKKPGFVLESTASTLLIGIAMRTIWSLGRKRKTQQKRSVIADSQLNKLQTNEIQLRERFNFYRLAYRHIATQLMDMDDVCQTIILQRYGIDQHRIGEFAQLTEQPPLLTEDEFDTLFNVAFSPTAKGRKLKDIAGDVGISPKQISDKHLACLDQLVRKVTPALLNARLHSQYGRLVKQQMETRLTEANARKQKEQAEKQRYAARRQSGPNLAH